MSFRPTISIYCDHHLVDIVYLRNWECRDLFFLSIEIAQYLKGYTISKQLDEDILLELEECSEFPIIIDLTKENIYVGHMNKPSIMEIESISIDDNYFDILRNYRIPFDIL